MKKRCCFACLLAIAMILSALTGCGPDNGQAPSTSDKNPSSTQQAGTANDPLAVKDGITTTTSPWFRGDYFVYTSVEEGTAITKKTPADTIVYASSSQTSAADPNGVQEEYCFSHQVYDCLIDRDLTGETDFIPALATEWGYDEDGNFNITLREGVKFHDGTILNADDVLFTLQRIAASSVNKSSTTMRSIDFEKSYQTDDLHLTLVFKEPVGSLLSDLASGFCGIVSKEYFENNPDSTLLNSDAGSGPYMLMETITGISQTFAAFDEYWGGAPEVKNVIYKVYKDYSVMAIDFLNGDLDVCFNNTYNTVSDFLAGEIPNTTMYQLRHRCILLNMTTRGDVPLSDVRLRQALAHCIDYEGLIKGVYQDSVMADVSTSCFSPGTKYEIDVGTYEYDVELAKSLLAECGYSVENPCKLKLLTTTTAQNANSATVIQAFGSEVGFDIDITSVDSAAGAAEGAKTTVPAAYDLYIVTSSYNTGSPENYMQQHEMYSAPELASGITGIDDPELNALAEKAAHSVDEEERAELYKQLQEMFHEQCWEINLHTNNNMVLARNYVGELSFVSGQHPAFTSFSIIQ